MECMTGVICPVCSKCHCIIAELIRTTRWSGSSWNSSKPCALQQQFCTRCVPSSVSIIAYVPTLPTPEQHIWPFPLCISSCSSESEESHLCYGVIYFAATTTSMYCVRSIFWSLIWAVKLSWSWHTVTVGGPSFCIYLWLVFVLCMIVKLVHIT
jgi:hypothetical protein